VNAIGGGGKLVLLPVMVAAGLSALAANITASAVLLPGAVGAVWEYRDEVRRIPPKFFLLLIPCLLGSLFGIVALGHTSAAAFEHLTPWLILVAVALFGLQPYLSRHVHLPLHLRPRLSLPLVGLALLLVSVYGGYFGAGLGLVVMALLGFTRLKSIYQLAALKNLAAASIELMVVAYFLPTRMLVLNPDVLLMIVGSGIGGVLGARWALKVPQRWVRSFIVLAGIGLAIITAARAYALR
jgi:uncharacterized membrane protein YfcA